MDRERNGLNDQDQGASNDGRLKGLNGRNEMHAVALKLPKTGLDHL